jgi:hypothetical protein
MVRGLFFLAPLALAVAPAAYAFLLPAAASRSQQQQQQRASSSSVRVWSSSPETITSPFESGVKVSRYGRPALALDGW